ncbi:unnamed protein product [Peronospora belbahrii]|uniref:Uncharacterized protein n=1 Tax=Peronospora belbahrii TaxID=622444 RepID=A0AAU9L7H3_9STRA|nr:unnamed protein product [Peronospora belbahrii]CAH0517766.1 unnamed protein product [Peronospora belbahrii]
MAIDTDEGVFLADDAIFLTGSANQITEKEHPMFQSRSIDEILYIASVIAQHQLSVDVVNSILEFAGVMLVFQAETSELRRGKSNMNEEYLKLQLPTAEQLRVPPEINVSKCLLLVADCVSKDQGWATDQREHNGTYIATHSWCEIAVTSISAEGESRETVRVPFCPNLRAGRNFRHHRRYFDSSTDLLQRINLGDCVSIVLRSAYPGWTNSAKNGRLAACFTVELNDDFSFAGIPFPGLSNSMDASTSPSALCFPL